MRNNVYSARRGRFVCSSGNPIHKVYSPELQKDGQIQLTVIGEENTDEYIQSFYESTTLECILAKFANGDLEALNRYEPLYLDVTQMPTTLAEAQQKVINSHYAFDALPVEIKEKFGNNYNAWLSSAGTDEWYGKMDPVFTHFNNKKESEAGTRERSEESVQRAEE